MVAATAFKPFVLSYDGLSEERTGDTNSLIAGMNVTHRKCMVRASVAIALKVKRAGSALFERHEFSIELRKICQDVL